MPKPSERTEPTYIGQRITWLRHPDALTVVVSQEIAPRTFAAIATWYGCWWLAGAGMAYGWWIAATPEEGLFLAVCLAFWAFFAVRIGKVLLWRKIGSERIRVRAGELTYKRAWGTQGRALVCSLDDVTRLEVVPRNPRKFLDVLDVEPWIIGGESLHLRYRGRTVPFGMQLPDREARALAAVLDRAISEFRASGTGTNP
jgi:hypothetical protein